jgi:hypothetical protein
MDTPKVLRKIVFPYESMFVSFAGGVWTDVLSAVLVVYR